MALRTRCAAFFEPTRRTVVRGGGGLLTPLEEWALSKGVADPAHGVCVDDAYKYRWESRLHPRGFFLLVYLASSSWWCCRRRRRRACCLLACCRAVPLRMSSPWRMHEGTTNRRQKSFSNEASKAGAACSAPRAGARLGQSTTERFQRPSRAPWLLASLPPHKPKPGLSKSLQPTPCRRSERAISS